MPVTPTERKFLLSQVNNLAQAQLDQLWRQAEQLSDVDFFEVALTAFPKLVDPFFEMAAQLSATWFEQSAPASAYVAVTAPPLPEARLIGSARWALGVAGREGRERLTGAVQRAVFDGARTTTLINVEKATGSRWVRHAQPNACAFCRLLCTRHDSPDYWYKSNDSALKVGQSGRVRGTRKIGEDYHDDCRCIAVEVREGQEYEPPDYVHAWNDEYLKARANDGTGDVKGILAAWRGQSPDIR